MRSSFSSLAKTAFILAIITLAFACIYGQTHLYSSNQNTYFVHGLAQGGMGSLPYDWLANTTDPFPLFSVLVSETYRHLPQQSFYVYQFALEGIYILSLIGITLTIFPPTPANRPLFVLLLSSALILLHAPRLAYELGRIPHVGDSLAQLFSWQGLAGQYVLGYSLQPSAFGVLLLLSILAFLRDLPYLAVVCSGVAASFHSTYLLIAAELTLCYLGVILFSQKNPRRALGVAMVALLIVLPTLSYSYASFRPRSSETFNEAEHILVDIRIPHHAQLATWFNTPAVVQLLWIALGLLLARKTKLFPIMLGLSAIAIGLTLVQLATSNKTLALLFPWRASVILIPLALSVVVGFCIAEIFRNFESPILTHRRSIALVVLLLTVGLIAHEARANYLRLRNTDDDETPALNFIADHCQPGDLYLIPPGAQFDRFRLATGVPVFIDYKSHPYKDTEVIDWYQRIGKVKQLFADHQLDCPALAALASQYHITHVIVPRTISVNCDDLQQRFRDDHFTVYRISPAK